MTLRNMLSILLFLLLPAILFSQRPGTGHIDSAKQVALQNGSSDSIFINTSFYIAEKYMVQDLYDSSQAWLNYIAERLPLRKPTYFNFYLLTYRASTRCCTCIRNIPVVRNGRKWNEANRNGCFAIVE